MKTRWKFLCLVDGKIKSNSGDKIWKIGKWEHEDEIKMCDYGLHCSREINQAFSFVQGEILAKVEVKGKCDKQEDKEVFSDMRIIKAYKWQKKDSVALSIYAAELCLKNFEKKYPNDKRPREAIEASKRWLDNPTSENDLAADLAAWSAESAAESAKSAESAWSARSAAWSARSAAWSAESARSAAWSAARSAAESAARSEIVKKIEKWFNNYLKNLEIYEKKQSQEKRQNHS